MKASLIAAAALLNDRLAFEDLQASYGTAVCPSGPTISPPLSPVVATHNPRGTPHSFAGLMNLVYPSGSCNHLWTKDFLH